MMIRAIQVIFLLTIFSLCGMAQPYVSKHGKFQVDQRTGCVPLTVNITVLPPFSCATSSCDVDLEGNNQFMTLNPPHTYSTAGTYWLRVLIGASPVDSIMITVTPDIPPAFNLYSCGANRITVDVTDTNYDEYVIDFGDSSSEVIIPGGTTQHTYSSSGTKSVTVRGRNSGAADNCSSATQSVSALASLPTPALTRLEVLDNASLQLAFNGQANIVYRLEIATNSSTNFQLLKTLYNVNADVLTNLRPDDNYYCFRIGAFDPCTNTTAYSTIMCSANLDLSVENNTNTLTWATHTSGFSGIRLERTTTGSTLTTTVTGMTDYSHTDIMCGIEYCYQLTTTYPGGAQSISLMKCGTAFSTDAPSPVFNITAVVAEPGVNIHWQLVPGFNAEEFLVYRSMNGTNTEIGRTTNLQFYDETYLTENEVCYYVAFRDVCQNVSAVSEAVCPIRLAGNLEADNTIALTWTAYSGWRDGVAGYILEKYSLDGQLLQALDAGLALTFIESTTDLDHQGYAFVVKARSLEPGLLQAVSNPVTIIKDPNLFYPTGFTPNGDNLNDLFNVYGQYIVDFEMNIFNRWGELLFTTSDLEQGWDGSFKGNAMPEGTYTFVADITDVAGRSFRKSGTVLLIRKGN